jgi:hypothetical protein
MKVLFKLVITLFLIVSLANTASANDRGVNGLIIGGGAGAIMGQAVGRNVESTIIGATVGGIIGAVIGAESSHRYQERIIVHKPSRRQYNRHFNHSPKNYSPRITHNRPHSRGYNYHRETIIVHKQHGSRKKGHYNNRRPQKRKHHSSNRYRRQYKDNNRW